MLEKADSSKKAYHGACRAEKSAYIQLMNSQRDASTTTESTDKTRERHEKCREEASDLLDYLIFLLISGQEDSSHLRIHAARNQSIQSSLHGEHDIRL